MNFQLMEPLLRLCGGEALSSSAWLCTSVQANLPSAPVIIALLWLGIIRFGAVLAHWSAAFELSSRGEHGTARLRHNSICRAAKLTVGVALGASTAHPHNNQIDGGVSSYFQDAIRR